MTLDPSILNDAENDNGYVKPPGKPPAKKKRGGKKTIEREKETEKEIEKKKLLKRIVVSAKVMVGGLAM
jgi:hypothetical protein